MDKKLSLNKSLLLGLILVFAVISVCVILFGNGSDVAYATLEPIEVAITDSVLTSEYSQDSNMHITGTFDFRDVNHFQVTYLYKTKEESEYHNFLDNKRDEESTFTFIFGGQGLGIGNYDIRVEVSCFVTGEGTTYGQWDGEFSITKAQIPQSIVDEMQPAEITYGQSFDEIVGMYSTNASFEFANNEDKKVKPVPGVYYIYFNIYPNNTNYFPAYNVSRKITVNKRSLIAVVDNQWSFLGEPIKDLTYNLYTNQVLPGDEDTYSFSVALDREITEAGTYYIIGTMVSDKYDVITLTPTSEYNSSTYATYMVYEDVKKVTITGAPFESVNLYQDNGFPLIVSFGIEQVQGFFNIARNDVELLGEYRLLYYENNMARIPENNYITEIKLPEYIGKTLVVATRDGTEIVTNEYIVDQAGRVALTIPTNGEFAIYEVTNNPGGAIIKPEKMSDTVAGLIGCFAAIGSLLCLGLGALVANKIKIKK